MNQRKLIGLLSLEKALNNIQMIYEIGEKAVGTPEETKAANIIRDKFEKIGLKNVHLEPYPAICRTYKSNELEIVSPIRKKIPCKHGALSSGTPLEGITAEIIDVGFGTIHDFKRLKTSGIDVKGNIVLVERNDRLTLWADVPVQQASEFGAAAVVFTSARVEHTALRTDGVPNVPIPALFIPYLEGQEIRDLLLKGKVKVNLKNVIEVDEKGISYNVSGELPGSKFPNEIIVLSAHHDSWFGAANDNASAVALIIDIARVLAKNYKPARTIRFISFGGEESGIDDLFFWLAGSYAYIRQHTQDLNNIIANINFDAFAYGLKSTISVTPEFTSLAKEAINELDLGVFYDVVSRPNSGTDCWSLFRCGTPILSFGGGGREYSKIYHTQYDIPELISRDLMKYSMQLALLLTLKLDSSELLPYDFSVISEILLNDLSTRQKMAEGLIDVMETINKAVLLKAFAVEFNQLKTSTIAKLSEKAISSINASQRRICSMLNVDLLDAQLGKSYLFACEWVVPFYLDMLITAKKGIGTMRDGNLSLAFSSLKSFPTMWWGINVSPNVYEKILASIKSSRYPTLITNLMPEVRSLQKKLDTGSSNLSNEASSAEKKYDWLKNQIKQKFNNINNSLSKSISELRKSTSKIIEE
ncbi:MAG: M28 family peptidase [Candidatus Bathyarchaeota archaeon]|nr:MAG: M28 family peptidase [Candidatus Bathyarchaeota archaeon]